MSYFSETIIEWIGNSREWYFLSLKEYSTSALYFHFLSLNPYATYPLPNHLRLRFAVVIPPALSLNPSMELPLINVFNGPMSNFESVRAVDTYPFTKIRNAISPYLYMGTLLSRCISNGMRFSLYPALTSLSDSQKCPSFSLASSAISCSPDISYNSASGYGWKEWLS